MGLILILMVGFVLENFKMTLRIKDGVVNPYARRLLDVDRVDIEQSLWALITGNFKIDKLEFRGLNYYTTEIVGKRTRKKGFNWSFLSAV